MYWPAAFTVADARYCFPLPEAYADEAVAPLLCAGLIGHRAYRMARDGNKIGVFGFGAAAHIIALPDGNYISPFDAEGFLEIAPAVPVTTRTRAYPLRAANRALAGLRAGRFSGAAALVP